MTDEIVPGETELDPLSETGQVTAPPPPTSTNETPPVTPGESSPPVKTDKELADEAVQNRINKITADKYEEKRRADAAEARVRELEGNKTPDAPLKEPTLADFDFDETKFNDAMIDYKVDVKLAAQAAQNDQQATDAGRKQLADTFANREAEFGKTVKDYTETVKNIPTLHPDTLDTIYSMENGPQLAHYLGSHLDVADKIATASPVQAAVELGRIAAKLAATTKTVDTSNAPQPVDTLNGSSKVNKSLEDMSMDEVMALE